jgi:hypothetical protein
MSSGGGSKSSSKSSEKTSIPDFLKPFMDQIIGTSSDAMSNLAASSGMDQTADLNPDQLEAMERMRAFASGDNNFLKTAQDTAMQAAQGGGANNVLPPELLQSLMQGGGKIDTGSGVSDIARGALESTASGDFLFGGKGFDEAVAASVRSAQPHIMSAFGGAGPGGSTSGLARSAIGQSATDAFASQYGDERKNMLGAANTLGGFDLNERSQEIGAQESDLNRLFQSQGLLAGINDSERSRQLASADKLPGLGLLDAEVLSGVGGQLQQQAQNEITGGQDQQMKLLMASLSSIPQLAALFGKKGKSTTTQVGGGFGV